MMREYIRLYHLTDLHYLSHALNDRGMFFQETMRGSDGKLTERTPEILDLFVKMIIKDRPDALIFSGDLSFNGELQSFVEIEEKLRCIKDAGIPVLVIPGNHESERTFACRYTGDTCEAVESMTISGFKILMGKFGYEEAVRKDTHSFSYAYALNENVWIIAIDANTKDRESVVLDETLVWLEDTLQEAKKLNKTVVTFTHQNVLKPNSYVYNGYVLENREDLISLYEKYGVKLNLSGHSHLLHIAEENGLTDLCGESASLYPLALGVVDVSEDGTLAHYEQKEIGLFKDEAYERFYSTLLDQLYFQLEDYDLDADTYNRLANYGALFNVLVFSGRAAEIDFEDGTYEEWLKTAPDSFWAEYMKSVYEENVK